MVAGRFRIEALLGSGGMADVYRAIDAATGTSIALKLMREEPGRAHEAVERVRREGQVLKSLAHPAIVRIETFGQTDDGRIFIAMELLEGETLGDVMRRGRLSPSELSPIVAGTCAGLAAAHDKGVVHRDLKPDNIFLTKAADGIQVKLLDFGIAKVDDANKLTQTGEVLGTPRYMAPEQLSAERDLDGRTDVYALGVILYEALAGKPPFLAATPTDLIVAILHGKHAALTVHRPDVTPAVEAVVARAMARAREARFATATDLAKAYVEAASGGAQKADAQREGMATAFMGSFGEGGAVPAAAAGSTSSPELKPGTFSELEQVSKGQARRRDAALAKTDPAGTAGEPPRDRGEYATRPSHPDAMPGPHDPTPVLTADPATPPPHGGSTPAPVEYQLPTTGGGTRLVVVGLLAGALSAGLAIAALSFLGPRGGSEESLQASESEPESIATPPMIDDAAADDTAATDVAEVPSGVEVPDAAATEQRTDPSMRRRRSSMRRRGMSGATMMDDDAPPGATAAELTAQARSALRDGDPRRCVELTGQALAAGAGPAAARLRGDCLLGVGDRRGALAAYERFCRTAGSHPSANEVRSIVEGMGGNCE
jgi:serine/threonine-protein kinase